MKIKFAYLNIYSYFSIKILEQFKKGFKMRYYIMNLAKYVDLVWEAIDCIPKNKRSGFSIEDYYYDNYRESLINDYCED